MYQDRAIVELQTELYPLMKCFLWFLGRVYIYCLLWGVGVGERDGWGGGGGGGGGGEGGERESILM